MTTFTCSYPFKGRRHVVHVDAVDEYEASRKLRAIGMTAQVDGELVAEATISPRRGWLAGLCRRLGRRS